MTPITELSLIRPEDVTKILGCSVVGFITQAPVIRKILDHIGRRFDPLKLPGRSHK